MQQAARPDPQIPGIIRPTGNGASASDAASRKAAVSAAFLADSLLVHAPKRRKTALLLCLFLGWMGAHHYYLGRRSTGRLYMCTCGLLFVGVIVDLVLILTGSIEDSYGRPLG
jgi:hypothetical protein